MGDDRSALWPEICATWEKRFSSWFDDGLAAASMLVTLG
jgi:hypothetical protein